MSSKEGAKIKHTGSVSSMGSDCGSAISCVSLVQALPLSEP